MSEAEHHVRHDLIQQLKPIYAPDNRSHFAKLLDVFSGHDDHHHIDTSKYRHPPLSKFSESQITNRTIFALKKIKEHNHHFFNPEESRILNPMPVGVIRTWTQYSFALVDATFAGLMFKMWNFKPRNLAILGGMVVGQTIVLSSMNWGWEFIQHQRRKGLANRYIKAYGAEFFHEIIDPTYETDKLHHLHNKTYHHDHHHEHH
mmetsp:Transcript_47665/g.55130  ORF Transcript_47665/g.55130 Transcript_47665/m.55130 type:complete len:203 (-) Transcript_47665:137-745(-)